MLYEEEPCDAQVNWGGCKDPRGLLTVGRVYGLERVDQHSFHTKYILYGIDSGRGFNSISFTLIDENTPMGVLG